MHLSGCGAGPSDDAKARSAGNSQVATPTVAASDGLDVVSYTQMHSDELRQLRFDLVARIPLGVDSNSAPTTVADVALNADTVYVLDGVGRRLRAYSRQGRMLWQIGGSGASDGPFLTPRHLEFARDTLYVTDVDRPNRITLVDTRGRLVRFISLETTRTAWSLAIAGDSLVIAVPDPEASDATHSIVLVADKTGHIVGRGCRRDPLIERSQTRPSVIKAYRFTNVSALGSRVFCQQTVTPVVQELDVSGRLRGVVNRTPDFFRKPTDAPETTDRLRMLTLLASWTPHGMFVPSKNGFSSVYTSYDTVAERTVYRAFRCDSATAHVTCGVGTLPSRPLRFVWPDTVVVLENAPANARLRLAVYVIRL